MSERNFKDLFDNVLKQIEELAEKARKYDSILDGSYEWTNKDEMTFIGKAKLNEYKDKAKEWDKLKSFSTSTTTSIPIDTWNTMRQKVDKWDIFETSPEIHTWLDQMIARANEWKEKARKWDESLEKQKTGHVYNWNFGSGTMYDVHQWKEKARKWDDLESNYVHIGGTNPEEEVADCYMKIL